MSRKIPLDVRRGRLSAEEKTRIEALAGQNWSPARIAMRLNRIPATINFHMATHGLYAPTTPPVRNRLTYRRNGHEVTFFTTEEDAFIEALRARGATTSAISTQVEQRFGHRRSAATILVRLQMLAGREEAAA